VSRFGGAVMGQSLTAFIGSTCLVLGQVLGIPGQ
jgi:hypothetical protein